MNVHEARRKCPEIILLPPNFERYRKASKEIFSILRSYTSLVEPVSIDEGYMDVTELTRERHALEIADEIQRRILKELDLPCSIGVAPNKFLAKTASDMKKPMGITVLRKREVPQLLWPLEVIEMHGVGEKTAMKLNNINLKTIGDLAKADDYKLRTALGINGERLKQRANGEDEREVDPNSIYDTKSVGNSTTLHADETDLKELRKTIEMLSGKVAARLKAKRLAGTTIILYIRDASWHNQTRSKTVSNAVQVKEEIFEIAWRLFQNHWDEEPVRLLGVTVSNVIDKNEITQQLSMFNFEEHPNAHTPQEISRIKRLLKRNPHITINELWYKMKRKYMYKRNITSLYRVVQKLVKSKEENKISGTSKRKHDQEYHTPKMMGEKWQIDVKYVPKECKSAALANDLNFYQYTCIDEATRERFLYWYEEHTPENTVDFVKRCIEYYGYKPKTIQTDNGIEFTYNRADVKKKHPMDILLELMNIIHHKIRPRTPEHT